MTITYKRKTETLPVETSDSDAPVSISTPAGGTATLVDTNVKAESGAFRFDQVLGATARSSRKSQGMTLAVLAKSIGSHVGNLSRIERGEQRITMELWNRICSALGEDSMQMWHEASKQVPAPTEFREKFNELGQLLTSKAELIGHTAEQQGKLQSQKTKSSTK